jgi:hypothetical protein
MNPMSRLAGIAAMMLALLSVMQFQNAAVPQDSGLPPEPCCVDINSLVVTFSSSGDFAPTSIGQSKGIMTVMATWNDQSFGGGVRSPGAHANHMTYFAEGLTTGGSSFGFGMPLLDEQHNHLMGDVPWSHAVEKKVTKTGDDIAIEVNKKLKDEGIGTLGTLQLGGSFRITWGGGNTYARVNCTDRRPRARDNIAQRTVAFPFPGTPEPDGDLDADVDCP